MNKLLQLNWQPRPHNLPKVRPSPVTNIWFRATLTGDYLLLTANSLLDNQLTGEILIEEDYAVVALTSKLPVRGFTRINNQDLVFNDRLDLSVTNFVQTAPCIDVYVSYRTSILSPAIRGRLEGSYSVQSTKTNAFRLKLIDIYYIPPPLNTRSRDL